MAALSPDEKELAFVQMNGPADYSLLVAPVSGGEPREIARGVYPGKHIVAWSIDGKRLLTFGRRANQYGLLAVPLRGGEPSFSPMRGGNASSPSVHPSGK